MSKYVHQFKYPGSSDITKEDLVIGNIFNKYGSVSQLGIQGRPGTTFWLNGGGDFAQGNLYPIVINETGIFELDLQDYGIINTIRFKSADIDAYDVGTDRLLIDIIYEGA